MKYIDLSQDIYHHMPIYPGDRDVELFPEKSLAADHYTAFSLSTGMHAGTHIDCPMHLLEDSRTIAEYPMERFIGRGYLLDVRGLKKIAYQDKYDEEIQRGDIVLILTGSDKYYGSDDYYNKHPEITEELAAFFVSRSIKLVGMDMPSPDYPPFAIHKLLLSQDILIIENLTNLELLLDVQAFEVFALPLKLHAEASVARVVARYE